MSRKRHNEGESYEGGDNQDGGEEAAPAAEEAPTAALTVRDRGACHLIIAQAGDPDAEGFSDFDLRYAIEGGHGGDASEEESRALIAERLASEFQTVTLTTVDADEGGRSGRGRFRGKR